MLFVCGVLFRTNKQITIGLSASQTSIIVVLGAYLVR